MTTFVFLGFSMVLALFSSRFGGVVGIVILWYAALLGPIALPMLLGLLLPFRRCGPAAAISCWVMGAVTFAAIKVFPMQQSLGIGPRYTNAVTVGAPLAAGFLAYVLVGLIAPFKRASADEFLQAVSRETAMAARPR